MTNLMPMKSLNPGEYIVDGIPLRVGDVLWTTEHGVNKTMVEAILIPNSPTSQFWHSPEGGIVLCFEDRNYEIFPDLIGLGLRWDKPK